MTLISDCACIDVGSLAVKVKMLLKDKLLGIAAAASAKIVQNRPAATTAHTALWSLTILFGFVLCCAVLSAMLLMAKVLSAVTQTAKRVMTSRSPFGSITNRHQHLS